MGEITFYQRTILQVTMIMIKTHDVEYKLGALNLSCELENRVHNFITAFKLMKHVFAVFLLTFLKLIVN